MIIHLDEYRDPAKQLQRQFREVFKPEKTHDNLMDALKAWNQKHYRKPEPPKSAA